MTGYAPEKAHFEILEVLAAIAAYQDSKFVPGQGKRWGRAGAWCIVRQATIRAWYERLLKRYERAAAQLSRRTLQYHLAALKRSGHLKSTQRHTTQRDSNKLALRPSIYEFTVRGRLWISRRAGWVENPAALLAAQKIAQSGFNPDLNSSTSLSRAVDKTPTARGASRPGKSAAARRRTSSSIVVAVRSPKKALVRKGARTASRKRQDRASSTRRRRANGRPAEQRRRRP